MLQSLSFKENILGYVCVINVAMDVIASATTVRKSGSSATVLRSLNLTRRIPARKSPPTLPPFTNFIAAFQVIQVRLRLLQTPPRLRSKSGGVDAFQFLLSIFLLIFEIQTLK
jgi:hypothetical protein